MPNPITCFDQKVMWDFVIILLKVFEPEFHLNSSLLILFEFLRNKSSCIVNPWGSSPTGDYLSSFEVYHYLKNTIQISTPKTCFFFIHNWRQARWYLGNTPGVAVFLKFFWLKIFEKNCLIFYICQFKKQLFRLIKMARTDR